jgi:hypothetical protein
MAVRYSRAATFWLSAHCAACSRSANVASVADVFRKDVMLRPSWWQASSGEEPLTRFTTSSCCHASSNGAARSSTG